MEQRERRNTAAKRYQHCVFFKTRNRTEKHVHESARVHNPGVIGSRAHAQAECFAGFGAACDVT